MRPVKGFRAGLAEGGLIDGKRVATADEPKILCNDRMVPFKTIAFGGNIQKRVDHDSFAPDQAPERCRGLHEPLLKSGHVGIPEDLQGHLRAEGDALRASDAGVEVIERVGFRRKDGRSHGAYLGTETAPGASTRYQHGMRIGMHPLLLRTRGQPHGDVLYRAPERGFHMPFEMGKDDVTVGLPNDPGDLNRFEVPIIALDICDVTAVGAITDQDGATKVFLGKAMLGRRLQTVCRRAATAGIQNGRIEDEGVDPGFTKPPDDLPGVSGGQETVISPLSPVDFYPHPIAARQKGCPRSRALGGAFPA